MFENVYTIPNGVDREEPRKEFEPPHFGHDHKHHFPHPPHPVYTVQEEFMKTTRRVNETLERVLALEQRIQSNVEKFMKEITADNVAFKNLCADTYNKFSNAITTELNSFESEITNSYRAFADSVSANLESFATTSETFRNSVERRLTEFENSVTASAESFRENFTEEIRGLMNEHRDSTEARIAEYNRNHVEAFNHYSSELNSRFGNTVSEMQNRYNGFTDSVNKAITDFENGVNERLDAQDGVINDAVHYFKTNINATVSQLLADMKNNGELNAFTWVTPEMFGAVGDGVTDDTEAINNALRASGYVVFANQYAICTSTNDAEYGHEGEGITPRSNNTLHFVNGAKLIGIKNNAKRYVVIKCKDADNVSILNPVIECDRTLEDGQHGFGITIRNCKNVLVEGATIYNALGDGIVIGTYQDTMEDNIHSSKNVTIRNCEIFNNRRQGITIGGVDGVLVEGCHIHHINGTDPQAGIDIEPNFATILSDNIIIRNCRFDSNSGNDITHTNGCTTTPTIIEGCTFAGDIFLGTGGYIIRNCTAHTITSASTAIKTFMHGCNVNSIIANSPVTMYGCEVHGDDAVDHIIMGTSSLDAFNSSFVNIRSVNMTTGKATFSGCSFKEPNAEKNFSSKGHLVFIHSDIDLGSRAQTLTATRAEFIGCKVTYTGTNMLTVTDAEYPALMTGNVFVTDPNCLMYIKNATFANNVCSFASSKIMSATGKHNANTHIPDLTE